MSNISNQTLALAGLIQACQLVDEVAYHGQCDSLALETSIASVFNTNPSSTEAVFGSAQHLRKGLDALEKLLGKNDAAQQEHWVRYALAVMHLEAQLRKDQSMLQEISKGLTQAESTKLHFGLTHENTISNLAGLYQNTISTFRTRVHVNGDINILKNEHNASKIRAILLCAVRAAMLWRQVGGHRWHLIFKRKALLQSAQAIKAAL